jgi:hypothetical protein
MALVVSKEATILHHIKATATSNPIIREAHHILLNKATTRHQHQATAMSSSNHHTLSTRAACPQAHTATTTARHRHMPNKADLADQELQELLMATTPMAHQAHKAQSSRVLKASAD